MIDHSAPQSVDRGSSNIAGSKIRGKVRFACHSVHHPVNPIEVGIV
jgi:hypothetical protein